MSCKGLKGATNSNQYVDTGVCPACHVDHGTSLVGLSTIWCEAALLHMIKSWEFSVANLVGMYL